MKSELCRLQGHEQVPPSFHGRFVCAVIWPIYAGFGMIYRSIVNQGVLYVLNYIVMWESYCPLNILSSKSRPPCTSYYYNLYVAAWLWAIYWTHAVWVWFWSIGWDLYPAKISLRQLARSITRGDERWHRWTSTGKGEYMVPAYAVPCPWGIYAMFVLMHPGYILMRNYIRASTVVCFYIKSTKVFPACYLSLPLKNCVFFPDIVMENKHYGPVHHSMFAGRNVAVSGGTFIQKISADGRNRA